MNSVGAAKTRIEDNNLDRYEAGIRSAVAEGSLLKYIKDQYTDMVAVVQDEITNPSQYVRGLPYLWILMNDVFKKIEAGERLTKEWATAQGAQLAEWDAMQKTKEIEREAIRRGDEERQRQERRRKKEVMREHALLAVAEQDSSIEDDEEGHSSPLQEKQAREQKKARTSASAPGEHPREGISGRARSDAALRNDERPSAEHSTAAAPSTAGPKPNDGRLSLPAVCSPPGLAANLHPGPASRIRHSPFRRVEVIGQMNEGSHMGPSAASAPSSSHPNEDITTGKRKREINADAEESSTYEVSNASDESEDEDEQEKYASRRSKGTDKAARTKAVTIPKAAGVEFSTPCDRCRRTNRACMKAVKGKVCCDCAKQKSKCDWSGKHNNIAETRGKPVTKRQKKNKSVVQDKDVGEDQSTVNGKCKTGPPENQEDPAETRRPAKGEPGFAQAAICALIKPAGGTTSARDDSQADSAFQPHRHTADLADLQRTVDNLGKIVADLTERHEHAVLAYEDRIRQLEAQIKDIREETKIGIRRRTRHANDEIRGLSTLFSSYYQIAATNMKKFDKFQEWQRKVERQLNFDASSEVEFVEPLNIQHIPSDEHVEPDSRDYISTDEELECHPFNIKQEMLEQQIPLFADEEDMANKGSRVILREMSQFEDDEEEAGHKEHQSGNRAPGEHAQGAAVSEGTERVAAQPALHSGHPPPSGSALCRVALNSGLLPPIELLDGFTKPRAHPTSRRHGVKPQAANGLPYGGPKHSAEEVVSDID